MKIAHSAGRRGSAVVIVLTLLLGGYPASPAGAAANDVFSVEPYSPEDSAQRPWFVFSVQPGQTLQDIVTVQNFSTDPLSLVLYSSDGITIPGGGGFAPLREDETPTDAGTWLTLPTDEITLDAEEGANIPFEIEVPIDAEPGDHAAVIVASDPEGAVGESDDPVNVSVRNRLGARVYIRVAGPLEPSLRVDDITVVHDRPVNPFADGTATITYVVSNTGNIRLSEVIQVKVNGLFGRNLKTLEPRTFPDVLPGGIIVATEVVTGLSPWEPLSAEVSAMAAEVSTSRSKTFYPIPWPSVILILLVAGLGAAWLWARRRKNGTDDAELPADARTGADADLTGAE